MGKNFETIIKYDNKQYMLSMADIPEQRVFEIMIFPFKDATVDNNGVYCYRTKLPEFAARRIRDIHNYPEKYLSNEAIEAYLACKKCGEWCCTLCKYLDIKTLQKI